MASDISLKQEEPLLLLKMLPDDIPVFIFTGYTDLRKSISMLCRMMEDDYKTDSESWCMTLFCGERADRFKAFSFDGDGYCLFTIYLKNRQLSWPRIGGKEDGEMWWIDRQQLADLMNGNSISEDDLDDEDIPEPQKTTWALKLYHGALTSRILPMNLYLCTGYTDLRKTAGELSSIISSYGLDLETDALYFFCDKRCDRIKMLYFFGGECLVMSKHLTEGSYQWPHEEDKMWRLAYSQVYDVLAGEKLEEEKVLRVIRKVKT